MKIKWFLIFIMLVSLSMVVSGQDLEWDTVVIGEGIKPALAIDGNDVVHVAYIAEDLMGGVFYTTNAVGWETDRVSTGYFYGPLDIAVSVDGDPVIAYHDHQSEEFDPRRGDAAIAIWNGERWLPLGIRSSNHDGWDNAVVVDSDGFWHMSSVDPSQFGSEVGIEYATTALNPRGPVVEETGSGPVPYEFATSIDITDEGVVGITYYNMDRRVLMYTERSTGDDGTWTTVAVDSDGDTGRYSALAFDSAGNPHITYFVKTGQDVGLVRYAWRDADGEWAFEDIIELEKVPTGSVGSRKITSIAFDSQDNPHIAYGDRLIVGYAVRDESGEWVHHLVAESTTETGNLGTLVELALDSQDEPHLVYFTVSNFSPLNGEVVYASSAS